MNQPEPVPRSAPSIWNDLVKSLFSGLVAGITMGLTVAVFLSNVVREIRQSNAAALREMRQENAASFRALNGNITGRLDAAHSRIDNVATPISTTEP